MLKTQITFFMNGFTHWVDRSLFEREFISYWKSTGVLAVASILRFVFRLETL